MAKRHQMIRRLLMPAAPAQKRLRITEAQNYVQNESARIARDEKEAIDSYETARQQWGRPKGRVAPTASRGVYVTAKVMLLVMECLFGAVMASTMLELSEVAAALVGVFVTAVLYASMRVALESYIVHGDESPAEQLESVRGVLKTACIGWVVCMVGVVLLSRTVTDDAPAAATALAVALTALTVLSPLFAASVSLMCKLVSWGNQPAATLKACANQREFLKRLETVCNLEAAKLRDDANEGTVPPAAASPRHPVTPIHSVVPNVAAAD